MTIGGSDVVVVFVTVVTVVCIAGPKEKAPTVAFGGGMAYEVVVVELSSCGCAIVLCFDAGTSSVGEAGAVERGLSETKGVCNAVWTPNPNFDDAVIVRRRSGPTGGKRGRASDGSFAWQAGGCCASGSTGGSERHLRLQPLRYPLGGKSNGRK